MAHPLVHLEEQLLPPHGLTLVAVSLLDRHTLESLGTLAFASIRQYAGDSKRLAAPSLDGQGDVPEESLPTVCQDAKAFTLAWWGSRRWKSTSRPER